jgi:hypothetical protein
MTSPQHQVPELPDGLWYTVKRRLLGAPLVTERLTSERLSKAAGSACTARSASAETGILR